MQEDTRTSIPVPWWPDRIGGAAASLVPIIGAGITVAAALGKPVRAALLDYASRAAALMIAHLLFVAVWSLTAATSLAPGIHTGLLELERTVYGVVQLALTIAALAGYSGPVPGLDRLAALLRRKP